MNSALLSYFDLDTKSSTQQETKSVSTLAEIATIATMFVATSAVVILLGLTWVA
jgi:hypothetical protein